MALIEIQNLRKTFQDVTAVDGLSLSVGEQEVHGILGPNGAGKSTTIACMLGLIPFDSGTVVFENGASLKKWSRHIGYVPQDLAIYPDLTAEENIRFFCSLYGFKGNDLQTRTEQALDFVGLMEVRDKKAKEFSGGMKRRLNLACGIVHSPKLIIMDEPTVGIDPQSRNRILENVRSLRENGATILYTTHYMPEVEAICNKITVIDHGRVIATGSKADIMKLMGKDVELVIEFAEDSTLPDTFMKEIAEMDSVHKVTGEANICKIWHPEDTVVMDKVIPLSIQYGLVIRNIVQQEPSLEELFLTLTGKDLRDQEVS